MKFTIDHKFNVPLYPQVEQLLKDFIKPEEYEKSQTFQIEVEIRNRPAIAGFSVRHAIKKQVF